LVHGKKALIVTSRGGFGFGPGGELEALNHADTLLRTALGFIGITDVTVVAAGFEVTFAMGMKYAEGFTRLWPSLITVVAAVGGIYFLTLAMRELPVSIAYPIWTAIGSLGTVFLGFALLGESLTAVKLVSVGLIVAGVAGLK
jgi:quaternary ammonium compound-resistance protein SugE